MDIEEKRKYVIDKYKLTYTEALRIENLIIIDIFCGLIDEEAVYIFEEKQDSSTVYTDAMTKVLRERRAIDECPICGGKKFSHYRCGRPVVHCETCHRALAYEKKTTYRLYNKEEFL